ncbi:MAG TPA: hypothetical protein VFU02_12540, partial [Polyangiaceae bacterium]|nr:hypothetical protein [Polyangiaceae bacterium]
MRPPVRLSSIAQFVALAVACHQPPSTAPESPAPRAVAPLSPARSSDPTAPGAEPNATAQRPAAAPEPREQNGNGARDDPGPSVAPSAGHFELVGRHWGSLTRICDLQPFGSALYAAHGTKPLGWDGASITRYAPDEKPAFTLAFDWNRPGEPTKGGAAGQGFLRLRSFHDRLFTPDADPPYLGLGMRSGIEGYVFVSDRNGRFARSRQPGHRPPLPATTERAGVALVPEAYHLFDVIEYQGRVYASTSVRGPGGSAPAALMLSSDGLDFDWGPSFPAEPGQAAWRFTYMVRFQDALLTGVEVLGGRGPDYVRWHKQPTEEVLTPAHATPMFLTRTGGLATLRWYAHKNRLYWITAGSNGTELYRSDDGVSWQTQALPESAGAPLDLVEFGNTLVLLTQWGLWTLPETGDSERLADIGQPSPFALSDHYCAAPLAVFRGELYAGGQRRGELYRFVPDASSG